MQYLESHACTRINMIGRTQLIGSKEDKHTIN
ncbi:hypothetical protein RDABS01_026260 [Bienertia sinuspersici]